MAKEKPFYLKPWFIALVIMLLIAIWTIGSYNSLVGLNQNVDSQWAQVETQYQRRYDLIPNLVNSVKGYMQFEKSVLENITFYRSQWAQARTVDEKVVATSGLESAISRLLVVMEKYPDLKADQTVISLMTQLEGTENRISVERSRFNEKVNEYNTAVLSFPLNTIAKMFGFDKRPYFEAASGVEEAPLVNL